MPITSSKARTEARALRQRKDLIDIRANTNPKGTLAKQAEMSVRRSYQLEAICLQHLQDFEGDPMLARQHLPIHIKIKDLVADPGKVGLPRTFFRDEALWAWLFDHWLSGGLARSREAYTAWLPDANMTRIEKEIERLGITSTD